MKRYIILYLYLVWIFGIHAQSYPGGTGNIAGYTNRPCSNQPNSNQTGYTK